MNNPIFIDTGAFFARFSIKDSYHEEAMACWDRIRQRRFPLLTSNLVVMELGNLIIKKVGLNKAVPILEDIYNSSLIKIIFSTLEIEGPALDWLVRYKDQRFSFTDATSFVLMEQNKVKTAFTFDNDFEIAGFQRLRSE